MKKSNISFGVTAFLDILGFGAQVDSANDDDDLEAILENISTIRGKFEHNTKNESTQRVHKAYKKTVLAFSDSVIVNIPLVSKMTKLQGAFDALMSELHSMAISQAECVMEGLFMRGGVDFGWWYRRGSVLVSTSMKGAYEQETAACVPAIALSGRLLKFVSERSGRLAYAEDYDPMHRVFRHFVGNVCGRHLDIHYLNYIELLADSIEGGPLGNLCKTDEVRTTESRRESRA